MVATLVRTLADCGDFACTPRAHGIVDGVQTHVSSQCMIALHSARPGPVNFHCVYAFEVC